ncbi:UDP-N-acetylglucosamine 2-epimerase [Pseudoalteromonas rubra]|uniref:UDP-N-acetylglucosamine 2-epimerase n=1 Tax=Pseudoalteromonas rubra TaxID=43658 RepID=UPI000F776183|nr:UDP-N-acetylglucosamine 2-epimerase [Pseudoalteromonas rubra]
MKKKILLVCYGGGHVKIIKHLYPTLTNDFDVAILAFTSAREYLKEEGIPFLSYSDFPELIGSEATRLGKELSANMNALDLDETIAYMGVNFQELLMEHGDAKGREKYQQEGRGCFFPTRFMGGVFDVIKPDLVVATNSPRSERAALFVAKQRGIPSVCVADNLWIGGGVLDVAKQQVASKICVINEAMKKELVDASAFSEQDVVVTGSPVFDSLKLRKAEWQNNKRNRSTVNILYADVPLPASHPKFPEVTADPELEHDVRKVLNQLAGKESISMTFRGHPNFNIDYSECSNVKVSPPSEDLHELLMHTDIVITAVSTVGLEGVLLGAQLITLENTVYRVVASYEKLAMSVGVQTADELPAALDEVLKSAEQVSSLDIYEGKATDNIKRICHSLLSN